MSIDVLTVVGARPQFIKAAVMSKEFQQHANIREQIVHTGQHYDANMSQIFFDELGLPSPKNNLGISGGSHAEMTASMMVALENCMALQQPDCVLLYGDTNSTLAAALAAAKLDIPICHAESGARTRSRSNPEEINRICTDHLASANCAPTPSCYENLIRENLSEESYFTGDLMFDAFGIFLDRLSELDDNRLVGGRNPRKQYGDYCYLTCHRQENTSTAALRELLNAIEQLPVNVVYPVHPRMKKMISELLNERAVSNLILLDPVGYFDSLNLLEHCQFVITDSGGLQREAFFARKKCITLLPFSSTEELLIGNRNTLVHPVSEREILEAVSAKQTIDKNYMPFGDGNAAGKIVNIIESM